MDVDSELHGLAALTSGKNHSTPLTRGLDVPPGPVWAFWRREKCLDPAEIPTPALLYRGLVAAPTNSSLLV
jgi:hypothetical protein